MMVSTVIHYISINEIAEYIEGYMLQSYDFL